MFAYCGNNPVTRADCCGHCYYTSDGVWAHDAWENLDNYQKQADPNFFAGNSDAGSDVYIGPNTDYSVPPNSVKVVDNRDNTTNGKPNPNMQIVDSYRIESIAEQMSILNIVQDYSNKHASKHVWERTMPSMVIEWVLHNAGYSVEKFRGSAENVDLDNNDEGFGLLFRYGNGLFRNLCTVIAGEQNEKNNDDKGYEHLDIADRSVFSTCFYLASPFGYRITYHGFCS